MMAHRSVSHSSLTPDFLLTSARRFGNWAVQRCLEAAVTSDERRKIVDCMK